MIGAQVESHKIRADEQIAIIDAADSIDTDLRQRWADYKSEAEAKINLYQANGLQPHQVVWTKAPDWEAPSVPLPDSA